MSEEKIDIALQVILDIAKKDFPDLPENLIKAAYEIEVKYQFEKERDIPLNELKKMVESTVFSQDNEAVK